MFFTSLIGFIPRRLILFFQAVICEWDSFLIFFSACSPLVCRETPGLWMLTWYPASFEFSSNQKCQLQYVVSMLSYKAFIMSRNITSIPSFFWEFIMRGFFFPAPTEKIMQFLSLCLLIYLSLSWVSLYSWNEAYLVLVHNLFDM